MKLTFEEIIQASVDELVEACELSLSDGGAGSDHSEYAVTYGSAILHFLRGEQEQLSELIENLEQLNAHPEHEFLLTACQLRQQIRLRSFEPVLLSRADRLMNQDSRWQGELAMLLATAYTITDEYEKAMALFSRAVVAFEKQGVMRKALRARLNVLVCESNLHLTRNLFARYHDLYRRSIRKGNRDLIVATTCLLNISREYQRSGAFLVALKYCNRALSLFELQIGELNYFLTLAHRAHLLCDLGRRAEARIDFEAAKLGHFKEVEAALKVIEPLLEGVVGQIELKPSERADLLPDWRERVDETSRPKEAHIRLSALEEKLIRYLAIMPRDRIDILEEIYGPNLEFETKLNRFKSLLGTLRKKWPQLVICEESKYRLADEILIPGLNGPAYLRTPGHAADITGRVNTR